MGRCRHKGQDTFHRMCDLLRSQILMQNALKVFVQGRIVCRISDLNPNTMPFQPQTLDIAVDGIDSSETTIKIAE